MLSDTCEVLLAYALVTYVKWHMWEVLLTYALMTYNIGQT